ncbi:serine/threonine-protein kinase [Anaerolineales bacterium HSG24]|nr:serine/threonine-protein kinase [Anaerolineales bacterium HSG24]
MAFNLTGRKLDNYKLLKPIGQGGMAEIYLAQTKKKQLVALKVLLPHLQNQPEFGERFLREANSAARLKHDNIVPIFDYKRLPDGTTFFAMEWIDGGSLAELMHKRQQNPLSLEETSRIISQIAAALDYAHQKGIVHRDIKPSNILLTKERQVKLADFGVAKVAQATTLTRPGEQPGTPAYMAPEQAQGLEVTPYTDIYALGIVLYEMLAGRPPFQGDTSQVLAVLYQQVHQEPPSIRDFNARLPTSINPIINKALAKKPKSRYKTANQLAQEVRRITRQGSGVHRIIWNQYQIPIIAATVIGLVCLTVFSLIAILTAPVVRDGHTTTSTLVASADVPASTNQVAPAPTLAEEAGSAPRPPIDPPATELALTKPDDNDDDDNESNGFESAEEVYSRPELLAPELKESFEAGQQITLRWLWARQLTANERFRVTLKDSRQQIVQRQAEWDTTMTSLPILFPLEPDRYDWLVTVERKEGLEYDILISSSPWSFVVTAPPPAPEDSTPSKKLAAPTLTSPPDQFDRAASENITLRWQNTALTSQQCYVLIIRHTNQTGIDYIWLTGNSYTLTDEKRWLSDAPYGPELSWQVVIVENNQHQTQACQDKHSVPTVEGSERSIIRTFRWVSE